MNEIPRCILGVLIKAHFKCSYDVLYVATICTLHFVTDTILDVKALSCSTTASLDNPCKTGQRALACQESV